MIKHPLVQKEWKNVRWVMLLFLLIYTFFAVLLNSGMLEEKRTYLLSDYMDSVFIGTIYRMSALMIPMVLVGITILVIVLFSHERNLNVGKFISSLPFSRKEQFTIKYIMGLLAFTLPLLLFGIVLLSMRIRHDKWISYLYRYLVYGDVRMGEDSIGALLLWLGLAWLIMLAVYSFLMLIQTLMGQNIIAGMIGAIIYLVPYFLAIAVPLNLELILNYNPWTNSLWARPWIQFFLQGVPTRTHEYINMQTLDRTWNRDFYSVYNYMNLFLYIAILVGIVIISTLLAYYFIQSNDVEKIGDVVMYPWAGKILVIGVTICSSLLLPIIIGIFTEGANSIISILSMAIGGVLGYIISTKSIELTQKHG